MKRKIFSFGLIGIFVAILSLSVIIWAYDYIEYTVVKTPGSEQFDFPGNYTPPELTIDGIADEAEWATAPVIAEFRDVTVRMYRGDEALFFFFDVLDNNLLTQGNANDDSVTRSDSIELYLDTLNNGGRAPQSDDYQFNFGIHNKTRIMQGSGSNWGNWNGLIDYEVKLNGTLNDGLEGNDIGYSIEVMVPYRQINIQKDSTIGVSFGRVDKFGLGDQAQVDWDWYGWTWGGILREPQLIDNYVSITADGTMFDRNELPAPDTTIIGTITNDITGMPIEGVEVINQADPQMMTVTDAEGYFIFTDVDPEFTYIFDLEHPEYFPATVTYTREELRASNGGSVAKPLTLIEVATAEMTHVTGQVKNIVDGFIEGATVTVSGTTMTTTTASDGSFEIENIPASNGVRLLISKPGYETETIDIAYEDVNMNDTTPLGVQNLSLAYNNSMSVGGARGINSFVIHVTRSLDGVRFLLRTDSKFEGPEGAILYLQGGITGTDRAVGLRFSGDGSIAFDKPNNQKWHRNPTDTISYTVVQNQDPETGASLYIEIPYAYLAMQDNVLMPFGLSAGSLGYDGGNLGWDGMGSPWGFVDPENFDLFARYNHRNVVYNAPNNNVKVTISGTTLPGTSIQIGSVNATANSQGNYSIAIDQPLEDVVLMARLNGYLWQDIIIDYTDFNTALEKTLNIEMVERLNQLSGLVVDTNEVPIEGATITISDDSGIIATTLTDELGTWLIENVPSNKALRIDATKTDMIASFTNVSLATLNGSSDAIEVPNLMLSYGTLDLVGNVANFLGNLEGATVEVVGASTTVTDANGNFTLDNIGLGNLTINISKEHYVTRTFTFALSELVADMVLDLETVDLAFRYAELGSFATGSNHAGFNAKVTRGIEGFEFVFTSQRVFNEADVLHVYVSTKMPTEIKDAGTYLFALDGAGQITITDFDQEAYELNQTVPENMTYVLTRDGDVATIRFILPYAFFGEKGEAFEVDSDEVIGIALAQYSAQADAIGTWSFNRSGQSAVNNYTVNRDNPKDYVRLSYDNIVYNAQSNATFDFNSYSLQFGVGWNGASAMQNQSDRFFANVTRDTEGITFSFVGLSNLYDENELILIYLDLNDNAAGGWNNDYLYKILGNGTLYGRTGAWWNALANPDYAVDAEGYELTIDRSGNFAEITLKIFYDELGIDATDTIGFAFREARQFDASHPDHQLYDPWHDFYYQAPLLDAPFSRWFNHVFADFTGIDAANEAAFVRISQDGTLYRAASNVA